MRPKSLNGRNPLVSSGCCWERISHIFDFVNEKSRQLNPDFLASAKALSYRFGSRNSRGAIGVPSRAGLCRSGSTVTPLFCGCVQMFNEGLDSFPVAGVMSVVKGGWKSAVYRCRERALSGGDCLWLAGLFG